MDPFPKFGGRVRSFIVMYDIQFTPRGSRDFQNFPKNIQQRIRKKLCENASLKNPLTRAKHLTDLPPATHRFRIGKYRVSFYIARDIIFVERVELRGSAYKK